MKQEEDLRFYLQQGARVLNLTLSEKQIDLFVRYYNLLIDGNKKTNLTHITGIKDVALKHFIDSLTCTMVMDFSEGKSIVDVGSGAGFPGIPLKIVFPQIYLTMVDSQQKKVNFLRRVIQELSLPGVEVFHLRAEEFGHKDGCRENFDVCVSRAVAGLQVLGEFCLPLVKVGGFFIALKGPDMENEIQEAEKGILILGGKVRSLHNLKLPVTGDGRSIVIIEKIANTPVKYPRRAGIPAKRPL